MPPHTMHTRPIVPSAASGHRTGPRSSVHEPAAVVLEGVAQTSFRAVTLSGPWGGRRAQPLLLRSRSGGAIEVELEPTMIFMCDASVHGGMRRQTYVGHDRRLRREHPDAMGPFARVPLEHARQKLTLEIIDIPVGTPVRVDLVSAVEEWPHPSYRATDRGPRRVRAGRVSDLTRRATHRATPQAPGQPTSGPQLALVGGLMGTAFTGALGVAGFLWAIPLATLSAAFAIFGVFRLVEPYL